MKKPLIGISCNYRPHEGQRGTFNLDRAYTEAVYRNGGIPQIIPIMPVEEIPELLDLYDGLVFSGGGGLLPHVKKMDPLPGLKEQNPVRYEFEFELIRQAIEREMPILGLCRGHQMINEVLGGTIVNLKEKNHMQKTPGKQPYHKIAIRNDSILFACIKDEEADVNSFHSQVVEEAGQNLKVTAYSDDHLIESVESTSSQFVMGLQFHPEFMLEDEKMMNIYKVFVEAARDRGRKG